jgi:hypothetical protein
VQEVRPRVLCAGIYLADRENTAQHVTDVLSRSRTIDVVQRWIALAPAGGPADVAGTLAVVKQQVPKCPLLNQLLRDIDSFDWIFLIDDDIEIAEGFGDALIAVAAHLDFALFQPARTHDSYIDHPFVAQFTGLLARQTRFVEIGPVVGMRRDAARLLLPFDERSTMGWGLDFVWPARIEKAGLRMGIIDAVPVAHRLRKPTSGYHRAGALHEMARTLAGEPHLDASEAFSILQVYS